jgi:DNA-binding PadR family transcriptional regulator
MVFTELQMLQFIENRGGTIDSYPFIEFNALPLLESLSKRGFVEVSTVPDDLDSVKITSAGREYLHSAK